MLDPTEWVDPKGVLNNLISNVLWLPILAIPIALRYAYGWMTRTVRVGLVSKIAIASATIFILLAWMLGRSSWFPLLGGYLALALAAAFSARGLLTAGIVDVFVSTARGVDYKSSLKLAQNTVSFLGIGADKLTSLAEFEPMIRRCGSHGSTARFLLSPPDNPLLEKLARQNGTDPGAYRDNVIESLRRLSRLKQGKGLNIEVRFYPTAHKRDLQQFRLMFIDDEFCLLSWTVWGKHLGKRNPQILLRNARRKGLELSLYKAFKDHFEEVWADADSVDLAQFL